MSWLVFVFFSDQSPLLVTAQTETEPDCFQRNLRILTALLFTPLGTVFLQCSKLPMQICGAPVMHAH